MNNLIFTNTFFEEELAAPSDLFTLLKKKPVHFHLHYLSCLLGNEGSPLLAFAPEEGYLEKLHKRGFSPQDYTLLKNPLEKKQITSFAPSEALANFAKEKECHYERPKLSLVKTVHSKEHTFLNSSPLPSSTLLYLEKELSNWWKKTPGPKVLKSFLGASGRGHFLSKRNDLDLKEALLFLKNHPEGVVAESWKERLLDFSTHWEIKKDKSYSYLGVTLCHNSPRGVYRKTLVAKEEILFKEHLDFLHEHIVHAKKMIAKICGLGFFGPIGIDAMLYLENRKTHLHPIVEVNSRKTMGSIALALHEKLQWEEGLSFRYEIRNKSKDSLLPRYALDPFLRQEVPLFPAALLVEKANLICF